MCATQRHCACPAGSPVYDDIGVYDDHASATPDDDVHGGADDHHVDGPHDVNGPHH